MPLWSISYANRERVLRNPHSHAEYAGEQAQISILNGQMLSGKLRERADRLILESIALHRDELMENWERARRHEEREWIEGLE